jgi:hypothetical protein
VAMTMTITVFWAMTSCGLLEIYRHPEDGRGIFLRNNMTVQHSKQQMLRLTYGSSADILSSCSSASLFICSYKFMLCM